MHVTTTSVTFSAAAIRQTAKDVERGVPMLTSGTPALLESEIAECRRALERLELALEARNQRAA